MKKLLLRILCIVCVSMLTLSTVGCSSVLDRIRNIRKPPAKTEPAKTEPAKTEPAKTEPAKTEPEKPDVQSLIQQGKDQREAGKLNQAIATFQQVLEVDPGNAEAKALLAETQKERDELIEFHMKEGLKYSKEENLQAALAEWEKVLALDPDHEEAAKYKERTQKQLDALK